MIGGLIAQLGAATTPQGASATPAPQLNVGVNAGLSGVTYVGFNLDAANPNPQDLTAAGATDWRVWGVGTTSLAGDDRKSGGAGISDLDDIQAGPTIPLRALGTLGLGVGTGTSTVPFNFSWSDGTADPAPTPQRAGLQHNNFGSSTVPGYGFSFTVPATNATAQLKVWVSAHHSAGILTATLGTYDPVTDVAISGGQNHGGVYTIDYTGDGTPGQVLTVSYVLDSALDPGSPDPEASGEYNTEANVVIYAAALSATASPAVPAPTLTGIYHVGSDTYYAGHMEADPNTTYDLTFASSATCPGAVMPIVAPTFATTQITTPGGSGTFFFREKLVGSVPTDPNVAVRVSGPGGLHSDYSPCVIDGPDNDTWPRAFPVALSGPSDAQVGGTTGYIDVPGRERWFKFTAQPGATVQVALTGLPADYDLVLFRDIGAAYNALVTPTSTTDLNKLSAEFASSGFTSSGFTSSGFTSSGFTSSGFTDSVYSSSGFTSSGFTSSGFTSSGFTSSGFTDDAFSSSGFTSSGFTSSGFTSSGFTSSGFTDSVYSSSGFTSSGLHGRLLGRPDAEPRGHLGATGTGNEFVSANTWTNTRGLLHPGQRQERGVEPRRAVLADRSTRTADNAPASAPSRPRAAPRRRLVVQDGHPDRLEPHRRLRTATDQRRSRASSPTFAGRSEVGGVVVDLASDARIDDLNAQADAHPACVYAKNLFADAIRDIVDSATGP